MLAKPGPSLWLARCKPPPVASSSPSSKRRRASVGFARIGLKRFLKFILPSGIVDLAKNRRKLRDIGRRLSSAELFKSDRLVLDAEQSGLSLFAPGHVGKLRNLVDVGANTGQWSSMLLNNPNLVREW